MLEPDVKDYIIASILSSLKQKAHHHHIYLGSKCQPHILQNLDDNHNNPETNTNLPGG